MTEEFLYYVWQYRHFNFLNVKTIDGYKLEIHHPGFRNADAGPDFLQAEISVNGIRWHGNVEIHVRASDWFRHRHQFDDKYNSVMLHVVYEFDETVSLPNGEKVATLELKNEIRDEMYLNYRNLTGNADVLSCRFLLPEVSSLTIANQMSVSLMEKNLRRQQNMEAMLKNCNDDWNELIYKMLAIGFGCKVNAVAFELLSQNLPYGRIVSRHKDSTLQLDALFFGISGFLDACVSEEYVDILKYEYNYLRYKYRLSSIGVHHWNWLRLRPQNFPTIRIAQFSSLMHRAGESLLNTVLNATFEELFDWFSVVPHDFWHYHYRFDKPTSRHSVSLGKSTINSLLINVIVPLRMFYARKSGSDIMQESAMQLYESVEFEDNKITRQFVETNFPRRNSADSQSLIHLFNEYCVQKKCLHCSIGEKLVRRCTSG